MEKNKVLYIAGSGRNGSTLLSYVLGQIPGFINVGEAARYLYNARMRSRNLPCGCSKQIEECTFWKPLLPLVSNEMVDVSTRFGRISLLPFLSTPFLELKTSRVVENMSVLYRQIASVTGARIIVDSSKHPVTAYLLSHSSAIDLYVLHLVRDPERVVYSWLKKKEWLQERALIPVLFQVYTYNLWPEMLSRKVKYLRVIYEEFVHSPEIIIRNIFEWLQIQNSCAPFIDANHVYIETQHALSGNPDKFNTGVVEIREGQTPKITGVRGRFVSCLMAPLRSHYGYLREP